MRVGIEVGGTFTDLIEIRDGMARVAKVPSTPDAPDRGAVNAIDAAGIDLQSVSDLVHGSTVATNAVLERKGGRVCVFVTRGTRDLFALQRHDRRAIYDLHYRKPEPIVSRQNICEIDARMAADGSVVDALDDERLDAQVAQFLGVDHFDAVAVCLLHSYANPDHERRVAQAVRRHMSDMPVTLSCEVSREFREYERASTTALAAFVQPVIEGLSRPAFPHARGTRVCRPFLHHAVQRRAPSGRHHREKTPYPLCFPDRRQVSSAHSGSPGARASKTSSPSTWAGPAPTSRSYRAVRRTWRRRPKSTGCRCARP